MQSGGRIIDKNSFMSDFFATHANDAIVGSEHKRSLGRSRGLSYE